MWGFKACKREDARRLHTTGLHAAALSSCCQIQTRGGGDGGERERGRESERERGGEKKTPACHF